MPLGSEAANPDFLEFVSQAPVAAVACLLSRAFWKAALIPARGPSGLDPQLNWPSLGHLVGSEKRNGERFTGFAFTKHFPVFGRMDDGTELVLT